MRAIVPVVSVVVVLLMVTAGLWFGTGHLTSLTASGSTATQTAIAQASSSSSVYPSRANLAIVGSGGNGDDAYFVASNYSVAVGATVTWTNQDRGVIHNVVSTGDTTLSSGDINPGTSWSFTFTKPGTYYYVCSYHPWMTGSVVVVSPTTGR